MTSYIAVLSVPLEGDRGLVYVDFPDLPGSKGTLGFGMDDAYRSAVLLGEQYLNDLHAAGEPEPPASSYAAIAKNLAENSGDGSLAVLGLVSIWLQPNALAQAATG